MSLKVWLPLNGNLNNLGTSNPNISLVSGNTWASSGKIGNSSLTLTKLLTILSTSSCMTGAKEISYSYWVKVNTAWSANWLDGIRWTETDGSATSTARQEFYTNCTLIGTWYKGGSISGKSFTPGVWTHLAATFNYNTGEAKFYINGTLSGTTTNVDTTYYCRGDFYIGDNGTDICENDFRLYDHALSAAEVREISLGLVLHYKLDASGGGFANPNLLTGNINETNVWTADGVTLTKDDNALKIVDNNSSARRIYNSVSNVWTTSGDIFTVSFEACAATNGQIIRLSRSIADYAPNIILTTTWQHYSALITNTTSVTGGTLSIQSATSSGTFWIKNIKLEKGTIETRFLLPGETASQILDSSGYGHNGTILNTISISSDTPRYSCSTKLEAANSMINCGRGGMVTDSITVNMWIKSSAWANPVSCTEGGGWNFEASGDYFRFPVYVSGVGYKYGQSSTTKALICNNLWHMLTGIYDRINLKIQIYVDGQLDNNYATGTSNNIGYHGSNCIWIGAEATGSNTTASNGMAGLFSDFRIYCTALDADAIRQLYQVSAKMDNKHEFHTFELVENQGNIANIQLINSSATSVSFDAPTNTYTIVSPVGTSSWGYGIRLPDTPALWIPYGATYRWTMEVFSPIATTLVSDYNNTTGGTNWAGNDNDLTSTRLSNTISIAANTWTRVVLGASNTHASNTSQVPIRDYSNLGLKTDGLSNPVTWKIRNPLWYIVDSTFKSEIKKNGLTQMTHFNTTDLDNAKISKRNFSLNAHDFIEN